MKVGEFTPEYNAAIRAVTSLGSSINTNMRNNLEQKVAIEYNKMVRKGIASKLRKKYRP